MKENKSISDMEQYFSNFSFYNAVPSLGKYESYMRTFCTSDNGGLLFSIVRYLEYDEIFFLAMTCKMIKERIIDKKLIKRYVRNGCISSKTRCNFWGKCIDYQHMEGVIRKRVENHIGGNLYEKILTMAEEERRRKNKKFYKIVEEIQRDVNSTVFTWKFVNQEQLGRALTAFAYIRPEIGYCQEMNFIAGILINILNQEEIAFWAFLSLINDLDLYSLLLKNMPDYSIRAYQLNFFIKKFIPELFYHFKKNHINPDIFFSKWILTIFSSYLPFETLVKVWDVFLIDKWKAIFKFSMAFLKEMQSTLIQLDMNSTSKFFRDNYGGNNLHLDCALVLRNYGMFKITNRELRDLREEYFIEQVTKKLEDPNSTWEADQKEAVMVYKAQLDAHKKKVKREINFHSHSIDELQKEYQSVEVAYSNQLNLCSELKLKIEELIESKSAYENVLTIVSSGITANEKQKQSKITETECNNIPKWKVLAETARCANGTGGRSAHGRSSSMPKSLSAAETSKNEYKKISKKLQTVVKEIEVVNKSMLKNFQILDNKKYYLEKLINAKLQAKQILENLLLESEIKQKEMIKNLYEQLKLSKKFVKTSTF